MKKTKNLAAKKVTTQKSPVEQAEKGGFVGSIKTIQLVGVASLLAFLGGCFGEKMPEVNDENCRFERIKKIDDKAIQQEFAGKCFRRDF